MIRRSYGLYCLSAALALPVLFLPGWLAETVLAALKRRRLLNRGFLSAPFSPRLRPGQRAVCLFLPELREDIFFLFLFGMILATALELATGVLLERIFRQSGGTTPTSAGTSRAISV